MKRKFIRVLCVLLVCLILSVSVASADLFGSDDKKMEMILREIKKVNTRIMENVIPKINQTQNEIKKLRAEISRVKSEMQKLKSGNQSMTQQMDTMASVIPGIQASMDQGQAQTIQEVHALSKRLSDLETKIKAGQAQQAQAQKAEMGAIKQEISANLKILKEGMAKDMEQVARLNESSFQELIKNNQKTLGSLGKQIEGNLNKQNTRIDKSIAVIMEMAKSGSKDGEVLASLQAGMAANNKALSEQNKKIIEILSKSLQEQVTASTKMDALGGNQTKSDENVKIARDTMVALKAILDKRLAEIDKTQQALQAQNDQAVQNTDLIKQNLLITDQKINKLAEGLKTLLIADQKIKKLAEELKTLQIQGSEVGRAKADLTNEKITRLIEILKAIAEEQGKMEQLLASKSGGGNNKAVLKALGDLRRKANVNISRSDSILKKLAGSKKK